MAIYKPNEVIGGDIDFITAFTLVDITDTGFSDPRGTTLAYRQAQNLNTLIQVLSLRTQLVLSSVTPLLDQDLSKYNFGSNYTGTHTVWMFKFASDKPDVWDRAASKLYHAYRDCNLVPIHTELTETVVLSNTFVTTNTPIKNLYFKNSQSL